MSKTKRINGNIEVLRYIFTFVIALMHFWGNYFDNPWFLNGGYLGVEFFFITSGFFLAVTMDRRDIGAFRFTFRKWFSMFWIYELSIFSMIAVQTITDGELITRLISSVPDMLGIQMSGMFYPAVNGILWYISAMLISGFLISYIYKRHKKLFIQFIAPLVIISGYAFIYSKCGDLDGIVQDVSVIPLGLIRAAAGMSLGTIVHYIYTRLKEDGFFEKSGRKLTLSLLELAALGLFLVCMVLKPHSPHDFKCLICFPIIFICAYSGCTLWGKPFDALGNGLTKVFGKQYTLTVYCFSIVLRHFMVLFLGENLGFLAATLIYLACLIAISWIITRLSQILSKKIKVNI